MSTEIEAVQAAAPGDSLESFCADLRQLRDDYPTGVSLNILAERSGIPKSTLSSVLAGKKMPTEKTLSAIVKALDGNPTAWLARRERLRLATSGLAGDVPAPVVDATPDEPEPVETDDAPAQPSAVLRPRWLLVLLLVVALLIGGGIGASVTYSIMKPKDPWSPDVVQTGDNPAFFQACLDDAVVGAAETRKGDYLMEIIWSANCRAGWGRITRYDDKSLGNRIAVTTFLQADPNGPSTQTSDDADAQSSYTYLIASHSVDDRICVKGTVTDGATVIDLGAPLCL